MLNEKLTEHILETKTKLPALTLNHSELTSQIPSLLTRCIRGMCQQVLGQIEWLFPCLASTWKNSSGRHLSTQAPIAWQFKVKLAASKQWGFRQFILF